MTQTVCLQPCDLELGKYSILSKFRWGNDLYSDRFITSLLWCVADTCCGYEVENEILTLLEILVFFCFVFLFKGHNVCKIFYNL